MKLKRNNICCVYSIKSFYKTDYKMPEDVMPIRRPIPEEDEDVVLSGDDEDDDEEGFENPLVDLLVTSDGENIADGVVNALDRVVKVIDTQNKIFIKMYSVISKLAEKA